VHSGAPENAHAESESTLLSSTGVWSIKKYLEALVRSPGVSERIASCFKADVHFADVGYICFNDTHPLMMNISMDCKMSTCSDYGIVSTL